MAFVVIPFGGGFLDRAVHSVDLAVDPRVVGLGQAMLDPVGLTDHVEAHWLETDGGPVAGLLGELEAIVGENNADLVGLGFEHVLQDLPGDAPVGFFQRVGS